MRIYPVKLQSNISSGAYLTGNDLNGDDKKNLAESIIELHENKMKIPFVQSAQFDDKKLFAESIIELH